MDGLRHVNHGEQLAVHDRLKQVGEEGPESKRMGDEQGIRKSELRC
jgi:hypothetical protein